MFSQKGFSPLIIILGLSVIILGVASGLYYLGIRKTTTPVQSSTSLPSSVSQPTPIPTSNEALVTGQIVPVPSSVVTTPLKKEKDYYTEEDGKVWVDVGQIVTLVNLYYSNTKKLPKSLDEISTLPDLSFATIPINPNNDKPYTYVANQDNSAFMVSGVMHDGVEYRITVPIQNQ